MNNARWPEQPLADEVPILPPERAYVMWRGRNRKCKVLTYAELGNGQRINRVLLHGGKQILVASHLVSYNLFPGFPKSTKPLRPLRPLYQPKPKPPKVVYRCKCGRRRNPKNNQCQKCLKKQIALQLEAGRKCLCGRNSRPGMNKCGFCRQWENRPFPDNDIIEMILGDYPVITIAKVLKVSKQYVYQFVKSWKLDSVLGVRIPRNGRRVH